MVQISEAAVVDVDQIPVARVQIGRRRGRLVHDEGGGQPRRTVKALRRHLDYVVGKESRNGLEERGLAGEQESVGNKDQGGSITHVLEEKSGRRNVRGLTRSGRAPG